MFRAWLTIVLLGAGWTRADELPPPAEPTVDFARDVAPLLADRCQRCHGAEAHEGGLRLHRGADALAGGDSGPAIVPGRSAESRLVRYVAGVDDVVMPPADEGPRLTAEEVGRLRAWIDAGAAWPDSGEHRGPRSDHWAYQPPRRPAPPDVRDASWPRTPIDSFILARLEGEGLGPSPEADRARLLRRVSLDLTGLPPRPEHLAEFLADDRDGAYDRAVDRLLASPAYGERWAGWWLDLARYADTNGYEKDERRTVWRYRDWVIEAFNRNLPFDRFTIEQLAGDLLPEPTLDQQIATGFHRQTMNNTEGGTDNEEFRVAAVVDRVNTTFTVWMATTLGCAQCHSHKYDPFTQRDYYRLFAFFNSTADADTDDLAPLIPAPTREQQDLLARIDEAADALRVDLAECEAADDRLAGLEGVLRAGERAILPHRLRERLAGLLRSRPAAPTTPVMLELAEPRPTHVLVRGSFLSPGDAVTCGVPDVLPPLPADDAPSRLTLARWLVAAENPLTARVLANRLWEQLFGAGLVETSEDFGTQGARPSNPELLDWLATELLRLDWDMKAFLRLIVTSAVYRQSSRITPQGLARDAQNRLLARGPRLRLTAEQLRDQALAVSGLLSPKLGGPSVMPPQPEGIWFRPYSSDRWTTSEGEDRYRRALYTFWRRTAPYPSLATFDAPSREVCIVRRPRTNTPLQALALLNDPVYVEAAQKLAARACAEPSDPRRRAGWLLQRVLSRPPRTLAPSSSESAERDELGPLLALYAAQRAQAEANPAAARQLAGLADDEHASDEESAERAAWTVVANVLLNLDETVTKG